MVLQKNPLHRTICKQNTTEINFYIVQYSNYFKSYQLLDILEKFYAIFFIIGVKHKSRNVNELASSIDE